MNSTALGDAQIALWSDSDSARNWFWRGLAQNQSTALERINRLLAQRSDLPGLDDAQQQGLIKALAAIYDKAHTLVGVVDINDPPTSIRLSGAVLLLNTFGTRLLQSRPASLLDGPMNTSLAHCPQSLPEPPPLPPRKTRKQASFAAFISGSAHWSTASPRREANSGHR